MLATLPSEDQPTQAPPSLAWRTRQLMQGWAVDAVAAGPWAALAATYLLCVAAAPGFEAGEEATTAAM